MARCAPLVLALVATIHSLLAAEPRVYRDSVRPNWFDAGLKFWYRVSTGSNTHQFVLVNAESGQRSLGFDHERLAAQLVKAGITGVDPDHLPISDLRFEPADNRVFFRAGTNSWSCDLDDYTLAAQPGTNASGHAGLALSSRRASVRTGAESSLTFINRTTGEVQLFWMDPEGQRRPYGRLAAGQSRNQHTFAGHRWLVADAEGKDLALFEAESDPADAEITTERVRTEPPRESRRSQPGNRAGRSPDGKWTVSFQNHNVRLRNAETGSETSLTEDGTSQDGYGGRIYWAPDSSRFAVLRTVAAQEHKVHLVESSPEDQLQPKLHSIDYLKPGDRVAVSKPRLFEIPSGREIPIPDTLFPNPWSITEVGWTGDSSTLLFVYNERGHQVLRVLAADAQTGCVRTVVEEQSPTFVCYSGKFFYRHLDETGEILWMSERDGWNHLYLYDLKTGAVRNQITRGPWVVREVDLVDADRREIWFQAGGIRPEQDPYYVHHCRVNFDGSGLVILTAGDGHHTVQFSPDRRYLVDTWSRVDQAPISELRRSNDGELICRLEAADCSELTAGGWRPPERFVARGRDGKTPIYGILHWPKDFDPRKRYPVVESIYAGPHGAFVPKSFRISHGAQRLADAGFIVAQIDGMGTSHRSKAFHDVCWKNLVDAGLPDRVLWLKAAAQKFPAMDLERLGIYGTSAGGQSALGALLTHGDFYRAAVADSGCHDNRMDKIWWNEQWMGWPVGPHYGEQSNVTLAPKLQGKLLLMVGELDRNVDPASTLQVVNALIKAGKHFELLMVPGGGHGILGTPYGQQRLREFFGRALGSPRDG